jgi:hypothetical protein
MTSPDLVLRRGQRYRVTKAGARMRGMKPVAPWTQQNCSFDLSTGDELEYLGMHYSGGSDGIDVHQFRFVGNHPDAAYARDFRPVHPDVRSIFDTRPDPSFLELVQP